MLHVACLDELIILYLNFKLSWTCYIFILQTYPKPNKSYWLLCFKQTKNKQTNNNSSKKKSKTIKQKTKKKINKA